MDALNLGDYCRHWARWRPEANALWFDERAVTWRELDERTDRLAAGLAARGVVQGDRVAVLMGNRIEWVELTVALLKLGALTVPLNTRFSAHEVAYVVGHADCRLAVTEDPMAAGMAVVRERSPELPVHLAEHLDELRDPSDPPPPATVAADAAYLCYTSGTTGDPKGAVLTHGSFDAVSRAWAQCLPITFDDVFYLPFPLAFTGGLAVLVWSLVAGCTVVLDRAFEPGRAIEVMERRRVTALMAVPLILRQVVDHPRLRSADLSAWRTACSGGAAVPPSLLADVQALGVPMLQMFGLTESSAMATLLPPHDAARKLGSAGLAVPRTRVGILDPDDRPCPPGEVGEIVIHGPQVMQGYWRDEEATATTLRGGGLHTGDLGYLDEEGYLYVVDRAKDMLITGGLNVYPAELERVLAALPGVTELAVIGVPHDRWGEAPAVIACTDGGELDPAVVLDTCRATLGSYKLPRYVVRRTEPLPRNMSGKVLKRELRVEYADLQRTSTELR
jgi:fatty-acyl-CoA synthase